MLGCIPVMIGSALLWAAPSTKSPRTFGLVGYYFLTTFGMAYAQVMAMVRYWFRIKRDSSSAD